MDHIGPHGWFRPLGARKFHYDRGDGRALCGRWGRVGLGGAAPIEASDPDARSEDDCAACRRKYEDRKRRGA